MIGWTNERDRKGIWKEGGKRYRYKKYKGKGAKDKNMNESNCTNMNSETGTSKWHEDIMHCNNEWFVLC
jgi:hypothetical protein